MALTARQRPAAVRQIICTHCEQASEASSRAMSIFCPSCHKRVILEDYKIRGYYGVNDFATCGDIVVERTGYVAAPIKVACLTVKGKVQGDVIARGSVSVKKTGSLTGNVEAPSLLVETGGVLTGDVRIGPAQPDKKKTKQKKS
jgi:hypothetical protein